jgi:hypothetical protein
MAFEKRANMNLILKDYNAVIIDADIILRINPSHINAHLLKGIAYGFQRNFKEQIINFSQLNLILKSIRVLLTSWTV